MKRTLLIVAVLAILIVLVMTAVLVFVLKSPGNNDSSASPGELKVTNKPLGIYLEWNNPSINDTPYSEQNIYLLREGQTDWQLIDTDFGFSDSTFISTNWGGFVGGQTYTFRITGVTDEGETEPSNEVTITPYFGPSGPTLISTTWGNSCVDLDWTAPIDDGGKPITGYIIHRYQYNDSTYVRFDWRNYTLSEMTIRFHDSNVTNGIKYQYELAAINEVGEGYSAWSEVKPGSPSEPKDLIAQPENGFVLLSWSAPDVNCGSAITDYHIYRYDYDSQVSKEISIGGASTHFKDANVTNGIYYQYSIKAENSLGGIGLQSSSVGARPAAPPAPTADRSWYPVTGDFIEYAVSHNPEMGLPDSTSTITVKGTSPPDTMLLNLTTSTGLFWETVENRSSLFGGNFNGANFDIYNPSSYVTASKLGVESFSTPWGTRMAEHWTFTSSGAGMYETGDIWILNGAVLKVVTTDSGYTTTLVIEDTNIHHILTP